MSNNTDIGTFGEIMLKSDTDFQRKSTVELARQTSMLFYNDVTVAVGTMQVVPNLYQSFYA